MELEHVKLLLVGTDKESQTLRTFPIYSPDLIRQAAIHAASKVGLTNGEKDPVHCVTGNLQGSHAAVTYQDFLEAFHLTEADLPKKASKEAGTNAGTETASQPKA